MSLVTAAIRCSAEPKCIGFTFDDKGAGSSRGASGDEEQDYELLRRGRKYWLWLKQQPAELGEAPGWHVFLKLAAAGAGMGAAGGAGDSSGEALYREYWKAAEEERRQAVQKAQEAGERDRAVQADLQEQLMWQVQQEQLEQGGAEAEEALREEAAAGERETLDRRHTGGREGGRGGADTRRAGAVEAMGEGRGAARAA